MNPFRQQLQNIFSEYHITAANFDDKYPFLRREIQMRIEFLAMQAKLYDLAEKG